MQHTRTLQRKQLRDGCYFYGAVVYNVQQRAPGTLGNGHHHRDIIPYVDVRYIRSGSSIFLFSDRVWRSDKAVVIKQPLGKKGTWV